MRQPFAPPSSAVRTPAALLTSATRRSPAAHPSAALVATRPAASAILGGVHRSRPTLRPVVALAAAALALGAALLVAPPAQAHNVLQGTDPADGSTVPVVPDHVTLTFSEAAVAIGTEIVVLAPDGSVASTGTPALVDATVTQPLLGTLPAGAYTVQWRVTSDDGHPVDGTFTFTAAESSGVPAPAPTAAPTTPAPTSTPEPTTPAPSATPSPTAAAEPDAPAVPGGVLVAVAVVLLAVGAGVAWALLRRRPPA